MNCSILNISKIPPCLPWEAVQALAHCPNNNLCIYNILLSQTPFLCQASFNIMIMFLLFYVLSIGSLMLLKFCLCFFYLTFNCLHSLICTDLATLPPPCSCGELLQWQYHWRPRPVLFQKDRAFLLALVDQETPANVGKMSGGGRGWQRGWKAGGGGQKEWGME